MRFLQACILAIFSFLVCPAVAQVTIADAGPDQDLCINNAFLEGNTPASGETGVWTLLTGSLTFTDPTDPQSEVTGIAYGQNTLQWTISDGMETTSDLVVITLYEVDFPPADAGPDQTVFIPPGFVQLQATPGIFPAICQWAIVSGTGNISAPNDAYAIYTAGGIGVSVLVWTCDYNGCGTTSDQVVITVEEAMALGGIPSTTGPRAVFDPGTGRLSITAPENIDRVIIADSMGRSVLDRSMNARSASFDVPRLSIGAYVIRVMMDDMTFTDRLVIVR